MRLGSQKVGFCEISCCILEIDIYLFFNQCYFSFQSWMRPVQLISFFGSPGTLQINTNNWSLSYSQFCHKNASTKSKSLQNEKNLDKNLILLMLKNFSRNFTCWYWSRGISWKDWTRFSFHFLILGKENQISISLGISGKKDNS